MSTLKCSNVTNVAGTKSVSTDTIVDGVAKAWVNFNGTGTVAIRGSFNVSSITDVGTGDYTINFTTAMPNANYAISLAYTPEVNVQHGVGFISELSYTTTGCRVSFFNAANSANAMDKSYVCVSVFR